MWQTTMGADTGYHGVARSRLFFLVWDLQLAWFVVPHYCAYQCRLEWLMGRGSDNCAWVENERYAAVRTFVFSCL